MSDEVTISYGTIKKEDIPLIMREPKYITYTRLASWTGVIIISLLILAVYVVYSHNEQKKIRHISSNMLMDERNNLIKRCDLISGKIDVPYAKSIEINMPISALPNISQEQLDCLFGFYITTSNGHFIKLRNTWIATADRFKILLQIPNHTQLQSLVIHTVPDQIFAHGWQHTFKSLNVLVRDKTNVIIWRDTIILDFVTGDSTAGYIGGGYIPLQFDLNKFF
jgi:hypothetical protein